MRSPSRRRHVEASRHRSEHRAAPTQTMAGVTYEFVSWSDGGAARRHINAGVIDDLPRPRIVRLRLRLHVAARPPVISPSTLNGSRDVAMDGALWRIGTTS